jgi:hypothetical protein
MDNVTDFPSPPLSLRAPSCFTPALALSCTNRQREASAAAHAFSRRRGPFRGVYICSECAAFVARPARIRERRRGEDRADHAHPDRVDPRPGAPSATATPGRDSRLRAREQERPHTTTDTILLRTPPPSRSRQY